MTPTKTFRVLDIFSGLGGWSKAFSDRGHHVETLDINPEFHPTYCMDIMDLKSVKGYDVVLASPPCESFSIASCSHHWRKNGAKYIPKDENAKIGIKLMMHTFELMKDVRYWFIENPRGMMRKLSPFIPRTTVWYCQYGDNRAKPTDIWTNAPIIWKRKCWNNNPFCDHEDAPRGARTGTQGRATYADRSEIPYGLSLWVCERLEELERTKRKDWFE
jgi:hypothetical protein